MRAAIFEHLAKQGRLKPMVPHVPQAGTKIPQALVPPQLPGAMPMPGSTALPGSQNNPNMIGNPKAQRFHKMKKMMGI